MNDDQTEQRRGTSYIKSILLGGFQVFAEPTTIPLGGLTLMFGPNSSGKSAIEDGLKAIRIVLGEHLDRSIATQDPLLRRYWRKISKDEYAPAMTLGLTMIIPTNLPAAVAFDLYAEDYDIDTGWMDGFEACEIDVKIRITKSDDSNLSTDLEFNSLDYSLGVNGREILRLEYGERIGIDLKHPALASIPPRSDFQTLEKEFEDIFHIDNGWVWINSTHTFLEGRRIDPLKLMDGMADQLDPMLAFFPRPQQSSEIEAIHELTNLFSTINSIALANCTFEYDHVPASRTVPTVSELTYLINDNEYLPLSLGCNPAYRMLAESCLYERLRTNQTSSETLADESLFKKLNRALIDHLFVDRGYSVSADIRFLVEQDFFDLNGTSSELKAEWFPAIVALHLLDAQGVKLSFEDVGSGIGYVLPALVSACGKSPISLIQQPELHLHPALQAAFADVFIEHISNNKQFVIETHSEHFLLRILKRIRQTKTRQIVATNLGLSPHDVVVLYFEPDLSNCTKLKHLRISEDGEFLDRWPNGFFTERDSELFDE